MKNCNNVKLTEGWTAFSGLEVRKFLKWRHLSISGFTISVSVHHKGAWWGLGQGLFNAEVIIVLALCTEAQSCGNRKGGFPPKSFHNLLQNVVVWWSIKFVLRWRWRTKLTNVKNKCPLFSCCWAFLIYRRCHFVFLEVASGHKLLESPAYFIALNQGHMAFLVGMK